MIDLAIRPIQPQDVSEIIDMQARVWQDYFLKEKNQQVPMMRRSLQNMNYYLDKEPGGCFAAVQDGKIVGSIISHVWGKVGWFGPLEVDAPHQNQGIGKSLVTKSLDYLKSRGCETLGCETMASSPKNMAFYQKMGFRAKAMSNVLYKRLEPMGPELQGPDEVRPFAPEDMEQARELWENIQPGLDYEIEIQAAKRHNLGEIWALENGAHAIVHTYEMFSDSHNAIVKLLAAPADSPESADILLERCEMSSLLAGKAGMFIRTYDATPPDLGWFFSRGYVLQSNSFRLLLQGQDEKGQQNHVSCWSG